MPPSSVVAEGRVRALRGSGERGEGHRGVKGLCWRNVCESLRARVGNRGERTRVKGGEQDGESADGLVIFERRGWDSVG